jgi:hypothetical protein
MWTVLRQVVSVVCALAFLSGMTVQAIPSAEALGLSMVNEIGHASPECPRMAMEHPDGGVPVPLPCKGIMPDCVKQMGCLGTPALLEYSNTIGVPIAYATVVYSSSSPSWLGLGIKPDLFPPIAD